MTSKYIKNFLQNADSWKVNEKDFKRILLRRILEPPKLDFS